MTLLEGHADVVMDAVGPEVIRSLRRIRAKFEARRDSRRPMDLLLRRVLGLDAKVAQYRTGAAFVRSVVDAVGHEGLNAVWSGPESLPSAAEIREPAAWVRRVHG
jgi:putative hydrolase